MSEAVPPLAAATTAGSATTGDPGTPLLEVEHLTVSFSTLRGTVDAVRGVSLQVAPGETVGVVGETGCGKSVTSSALLGLIPTPPGKVTAARFRFQGRDMLRGDVPVMDSVRGRGIGMIFQDPSSALNPVFAVGNVLMAVIVRHHGVDRREARQRAVHWLERVELPGMLERYPHQLSGGQKQRVAIATALAGEPALIVADEPTTALDVTIQAQVLELMRSLQREMRLGVLFITHDLGVVAQMCHRVLVMYAGRVVEEAPLRQLFEAPAHPYTAGLFAALPGVRPREKHRLEAIPGSVPAPSSLPRGCAFHPRCPRARPQCEESSPPLQSTDKGEARVACFFPLGGAEVPQ